MGRGGWGGETAEKPPAGVTTVMVAGEAVLNSGVADCRKDGVNGALVGRNSAVGCIFGRMSRRDGHRFAFGRLTGKESPR